MANHEEVNKRMDILLMKNMNNIQNKLLVLSNKGGVGKSTVAVNMAVYLSKKGFKVGLLDADIHGPSVARMLGFEGKKLENGPDGIIPIEASPGLVAVSMAGVLGSNDTPVIWRGPMKMVAIKQFLAEVDWGVRDYLIIDAPPGTGDEPLSICQLIKDLTGAIIVTTSQEIALLDSRKCINFLKELKVPIAGIIENMSSLVCPKCGENINIFSSGGAEKTAKDMGIPFLGRLPFEPEIVKGADKGKAFIETHPKSEATKVLKNICDSISEKKQK